MARRPKQRQQRAGALLLLFCHATAYIPPEEYRHEQLSAMQAAFSRFSSGGPEGSVERADLPNFVRFVFTAMNSAGVPQEKVVARSTELTQKLMKQLPASATHFTLSDMLRATEKVIEYPTPTADDLRDEEHGQMGSKQLRKMRKKLAENRLTMPLFDTKGWVRDFEKALLAQWEIYANGRKPMHIVVARSDRLYGVERWPVLDSQKVT